MERNFSHNKLCAALSELSRRGGSAGRRAVQKTEAAMKKVLWISRHQMTPEQLRDLERIAGGQVELNQYGESVMDIRELAPLLHGVDLIAAVLPTHLLAQLLRLADGIPVLQAVSERRATGRLLALPDGRREREYAFVHAYWQQILRLELETVRL